MLDTIPKPKAENFGWQFLRGTSQELALAAPAHHILYHGARGPGKTDTQLMRFRRNVGLGYGAFWRGIIFDREYKNLDDLVKKSKRWFYDFNDGAEFLESTSSYKWRWPTGEELLFRVAKTPDDYWAYHGHEFAFIGWNELTKYPDSRVYEKMNTINRSSFMPIRDTPRLGHNGGPPMDDADIAKLPYATKDGLPLPPVPLEVFSTANPYGPGHSWVKKMFILPAPDGEIVRSTAKVFDPATKEEVEVTKKQVAIHGHWSENPFLDKQYILTLYGLSDENERKAWKDGSWDINAGGAIADLWTPRKHIVKRFPIPENWRIFRSFDWGSTHPFSVGWWAESNGETVTWYDWKDKVEREITVPRGTLVRFFEWYGNSGATEADRLKNVGNNKGSGLGSKAIALKIVAYEEALIKGGWIARRPSAGPADNQIRNVNDSDTETIEKIMADNGVTWTPSDKSKDSRKIGLQLLRDRLENTKNDEGRGIVWTENCRFSIAILPDLPRNEDNPDDVDTDAEDHVYDETRYVVLSAGDRTVKSLKALFPS